MWIEKIYDLIKTKNNNDWQLLRERLNKIDNDITNNKNATSKNSIYLTQDDAESNLAKLQDKIDRFDLPLLEAAKDFFEQPNAFKTGTGLKNQNIYDLGRYYLDKNKFDNGLFELRYKKNKHLSEIKPIHLTSEMKKIISDMVHTKTFNIDDYHKLNNFDKNTIRLLNNKFGLGININSDNALDKRFEIIKGEILAGNDNLALKREAKQYLLHAMRVGKIPRNVCYDLMMEMDL
jgi:Ni,Fe-hydrogenase I large subunit